MSSNNVIHKIQIAVKPHFGNQENKFENVMQDGLAEAGVFEFE